MEECFTAQSPKSRNELSQFRYDAAKDVYLCPGEQALTYRFSTFELGRVLRCYRASGCNTCALKGQCTRNKANRTITREDMTRDP